jgi:hypothetical protein
MKKTSFCLLLCLLFALARSSAQTGMTVSPGKMYYKLLPGASATQKLIVSNPNDKALEISVSVTDWNYDSTGNTLTYDAGTLNTSCADWVQIMPGSYFTLQPHEKRELTVVMTVPQNADRQTPVHNAMVFLTQLNPGTAKTADGTSIAVSVRMGVKLYHSFTTAEERDIDIIAMKDVAATGDQPAYLEMTWKNTGRSWLEGKVKWELLNMQTGQKQKLEEQDIFSLPGDLRMIRQILPANLSKGKYTATAVVNYGNKDELKIAELEFTR